MKYYFFTLFAASLIGCQDSKKQSEKDRLIADQQEKINELQSQVEQKEADNQVGTRNTNYEAYKEPDLVQIGDSKYAFAIITVESKTVKSVYIDGEFYHPEEKHLHKHVTNIHEIQLYSEEKALKFRDKVRSMAKFSQYMNGKVTHIEVKTYSTYKDATQAREKVENEGEVTIFLPNGV